MRYVISHDKQKRSLSPNAVQNVERHTETFEQQRAALTRTLCELEALTKTLSRGSLKYQGAKARIVEIQNELRVLKGKMGFVKKNENLSDFLIQIFKERVTKAEWDGVVVEARRRYELQAHAA
jgi:hypothetical protein